MTVSFFPVLDGKSGHNPCSSSSVPLCNATLPVILTKGTQKGEVRFPFPLNLVHCHDCLGQ